MRSDMTPESKLLDALEKKSSLAKSTSMFFDTFSSSSGGALLGLPSTVSCIRTCISESVCSSLNNVCLFTN